MYLVHKYTHAQFYVNEKLLNFPIAQCEHNHSNVSWMTVLFKVKYPVLAKHHVVAYSECM